MHKGSGVCNVNTGEPEKEAEPLYSNRFFAIFSLPLDAFPGLFSHLRIEGTESVALSTARIHTR